MAKHHGHAYFTRMLKDLEERVYNFRIYDRVHEINTYCDDLMTQVVVTIESAIKHLHQVEEDLVNQINKYRLEIIETTPPAQESDDIKQEFANFSREVEDFITRCLAQLDQHQHPTLTDEIVENIQQGILFYSTRSREIETTKRNHSFLNQFMKFQVNRLFFIERYQIGRLEIFDLQAVKKKNQVYNLRLSGKERGTAIFEAWHLLRRACLLSNGNVAYSIDMSIHIWDTEAKKDICLSDGLSKIMSLVELPFGYLASGTDDGLVILWDLMQLRQVSSTKAHRSFVVTMKVLKNGNLASLCDLDDIKIWKIDSKGKLNLQLKIPDHLCWYNELSELSNGYIVGYSVQSTSTTYSATIKIWDPIDGRLVKSIETHVKSRHYCVLSNDQIAVANEDENNILIFNPDEDFPCRVIGNDLSVLALYSFTGSLLIAHGYDGTLKHLLSRIYNVENGEIIGTALNPRTARHDSFKRLPFLTTFSQGDTRQSLDQIKVDNNYEQSQPPDLRTVSVNRSSSYRLSCRLSKIVMLQ